MIKNINTKPDIFNHVPEPTICFSLLDNEKIYGYIIYNVVGELAGIHSEIFKWNHIIARKLKKDFDSTARKVKKLGVKKIVASHLGKDEKWEKFIKLYGFPKPQLTMMSIKEV